MKFFVGFYAIIFFCSPLFSMNNSNEKNTKEIFLQELVSWEKSILLWEEFSYQTSLYFECRDTKTKASVKENTSNLLKKMFFLSVKEKWLSSAFSILLNLSSEDKKKFVEYMKKIIPFLYVRSVQTRKFLFVKDARMFASETDTYLKPMCYYNIFYGPFWYGVVSFLVSHYSIGKIMFLEEFPFVWRYIELYEKERDKTDEELLLAETKILDHTLLKKMVERYLDNLNSIVADSGSDSLVDVLIDAYCGIDYIPSEFKGKVLEKACNVECENAYFLASVVSKWFNECLEMFPQCDTLQFNDLTFKKEFCLALKKSFLNVYEKTFEKKKDI